MKTQDQFVSSVMTALPARESVMSRVGRALCAFILSPVWMWLCMVVLVVLFRRPILAILVSLPEFSITSILLTILIGLSAVCYFARQMCRAI